MAMKKGTTSEDTQKAEAFGRYLTAQLRARGIPQRQFANMAHTSAALVSQACSGKKIPVMWEHLVRFADVLGISRSKLLQEAGISEPVKTKREVMIAHAADILAELDIETQYQLETAIMRLHQDWRELKWRTEYQVLPG